MSARDDARPCEPCGKRLYVTELVAIRVALLSSRRRGTPLRVYRCPMARGFHLTSHAKKEAA